MLLFKETAHLRHFLNTQNKPIGFIPTMGALHQGHLSLIQKAAQECQLTVVSIFVNPTQFNDLSDFEKFSTKGKEAGSGMVNVKYVVSLKLFVSFNAFTHDFTLYTPGP